MDDAHERYFEAMGEADVREDILAPLISRLGYANTPGGPPMILREHQLTYPNLFLGRKKVGRDYALRGVADYLVEVKNHARWTLEAKAPAVPIDDDAVQQAWTYAAHAEVQAVYFLVSNGRLFNLYSTSSCFQGPLLTISYEELEHRFDELAAFLSPASLARQHPNHLLSLGAPLGPGLRSVQRVASGTITHITSTLPLPLLTQMQVQIVDGTLMRDENGKLRVLLKTRAPFRELQSIIEGMALDVMDFRSEASELSIDPKHSTAFEYRCDAPFPYALDNKTFQAIRLPTPMDASVVARVRATLAGDQLSGAFEADLTLRPVGAAVVTVQQRGEFEIRLS